MFFTLSSVFVLLVYYHSKGFWASLGSFWSYQYRKPPFWQHLRGCNFCSNIIVILVRCVFRSATSISGSNIGSASIHTDWLDGKFCVHGVPFKCIGVFIARPLIKSIYRSPVLEIVVKWKLSERTLTCIYILLQHMIIRVKTRISWIRRKVTGVTRK